MYCLLCHEKISRWRRLKTGSDFCCDEHLEQYKREAVGRLLEYHETKSSQPAEDPIHRLGLIGVGPPVVEEPRRPMELQSFAVMEVRRYNPERDTNLWLFHDGSAISPRPRLPLSLDPLTLWDPSRAARAGLSTLVAPPPPPVISRRVPDPLASLLKAHPATTAGPVWVDLRLLDPGLPRLSARSLWEGPRLAGNGRAVRQPTLEHRGGLLARVAGVGSARPVEDFLSVVVPTPAGSPSLGVAGSHLQICSATPAICLVPPGVLEQAAFVPARRQAAGFRELAAALRERESQPWRPAELRAGSNRPAYTVRMPGAPQQAGLAGPPKQTAGIRELAVAWRGPESRPWRRADLGARSNRPAYPVQMPGVLERAAFVAARVEAAGLRNLSQALREPESRPWRPSDLGTWSDRPAYPVQMPGVLERAAFVPARVQAAGLRDLAEALREPESKPWRPTDLRAWSARPAYLVRMPGGPPPRNMTTLVRPPEVARPRVFAALPPVPGEEATARVILLSPRFADRVRARKMDTTAEPRAPVKRLEPPPLELNPIGVPQAWTPSQEEEFRCRPLTPSTALDRPFSPIRTEAVPAAPPPVAHLPVRSLVPLRPAARRLMLADTAQAWPSPVDTRQAGQAPCGARPPEVSAQNLKLPRFAAIRRRSAAPAGQFVEMKPYADKVGIPQAPAPVLAGLGGSAPQSQAVPGPELRKVALTARSAVKAPSLQPLPPVEQSAEPDDIAVESRDTVGKPEQPAPDAAVERARAEDALRLALEESERARAGLKKRLPRQAALAWHEIVLPALADRRAKAGLVAGVTLVVLLWSLHNPKSMTNAALEWAVRPLQERSYFLFEENFQQGADAWTNPAILSRRADGLAEIQTGVSLYRPSLGHEDYEFSFSGLIRKGALDWVVRAADDKNYYAFKLTRQGTGRERRSVLLRYAVINGSEADKPHASAVPFDVEENKVYHVTVQISGERTTTMVFDRGVDSFSDSRLKRGGVGFFAEPGEVSLVHSLSVVGNDDPTGRAIVWVRDFYRFCTRQSGASRAGN
ncbi:MAG: hypothetical protein HY238_08690 [Acidobacteria bacterium]|nr:hypothetical protein [Acidobacteriota bacterium]